MLHLLKALISVKQKPKHQITDLVTHRQWVKPWHIDIYMHVNNAKYLNYFELARWNFSNKTGLTKYLLKHQLKFIIVGAELAYVKDLVWFQKFNIQTKLVGHDEKYVYFEQTLYAKNKLVNHALFKVIFLKQNKKITPQDLFYILGITNLNNKLPDAFALWQKVNEHKKMNL